METFAILLFIIIAPLCALSIFGIILNELKKSSIANRWAQVQATPNFFEKCWVFTKLFAELFLDLLMIIGQIVLFVAMIAGLIKKVIG